MTSGFFTLSGGYDCWRIWCGPELVSTFPTLSDAWAALRASREAIEQVFS